MSIYEVYNPECLTMQFKRVQNESPFLTLLNLGQVLPIEEVSNILQKITLTHELGLGAYGLQR